MTIKSFFSFLEASPSLIANFSNVFLFNKKIENKKELNDAVFDQYEEIAKLVKEARIQQNLTIQDLSIISKIPVQTINSIENNDIIYSVKHGVKELDKKNRNNIRSIDQVIKTPRKSIIARSKKQSDYLKALQSENIVMSLGPAGTGKSYLAVSVAVTMLMEKKIDRVILSRPAVEAGERLGFLPGDMKEKVDPYLRPLYDAHYDLFGFEQIQRKIDNGSIEIAPLAFMRGRTLKNSFAILDEAQNCLLYTSDAADES